MNMNDLDELRSNIKDFINKHHLTYTEYCLGTKLNSSVLSSFLRETYTSKMLPRTVLRIMKVHRMKVEQYEE